MINELIRQKKEGTLRIPVDRDKLLELLIEEHENGKIKYESD